MKKVILAVILVVVFFSGCAGFRTTVSTDLPADEKEFDMTGEWEGKIMIAGQELSIVVRFFDSDPPQAEIDIPQQGAYKIPLTNLDTNGKQISFSLPAGPGKALFTGVLDEDASGSHIEGDFEQGGVKGTFELTYTKSVNRTDIPVPEGIVNNSKAVSQYREEELNLDTGTGILQGTLTLPDGEGPFPAALIIAGSGPTDRNGNSPLLPGKNNSLHMLAQSLAEAGFASLRTDKRGIGASTGALLSEADLIFSDYVDDYVLWFENLDRDSRIGPVGVIGHSEGSLIGAATALRTNSRYMISLAGVGEPAYQTLERQLTAQSPAAAEIAVEIMNSLRAGEMVESIPQGFESLFRKSVQPYLISWFSYDPVEIMGNLDIPVLIVQGTTDIQVSLEDAEKLKSANPKAELVIIEGMNHVLKTAPLDQEANLAAYSNPDLPLTEGLMAAILQFISLNQLES